MDKLNRLNKEVTDSLNRYVKLNEKYKEMLPKVDASLPTWTIDLEKLNEVDELGRKVERAREEWHKKMREYLENKQKNK
jgi:hypothetical protein